MASEFTANQVQGVFGEFKAVLDFADVTVTAENVNGVFGKFQAVLDEAATAGAVIVISGGAALIFSYRAATQPGLAANATLDTGKAIRSG